MGKLARLPVFLALDGKRAVLAGGSNAAAWKAELLSASGARVDVYARDVSDEMRAIAADAPGGAIAIIEREWLADDFKDAAIAIGETPAPVVEPTPIMTFAEWQATGRDVEDLEAALPGHSWEGAGRIYAGDLVIERSSNGTGWCLTIANASWASETLESLEEELYQFATCEGVIDQPVDDDSRSNGDRS
jgi:hypothetical protein